MTIYYQDDLVTLHRGDALAMLAGLPDESVDAFITDPPYSSGGMTRGDRVMSTGAKYVTSGSHALENSTDFAGDNRDQRAYAYWSALWLAEALRATRTGGAMVIFTDWRQLATTTDALQAGGWVFRGIVPWVKPYGSARPQAGRFMAQCEYVVWGSRGTMPIRPGVDPCLPGFFHGASPRSDIREHQTQKPLNIIRELVQICPVGGTVADPFMGSGTSGVAAVVEGRRFVGCEVVDHHAAVAERRICEARLQYVTSAQQAQFEFGSNNQPEVTP